MYVNQLASNVLLWGRTSSKTRIFLQYTWYQDSPRRYQQQKIHKHYQKIVLLTLHETNSATSNRSTLHCPLRFLFRLYYSRLSPTPNCSKQQLMLHNENGSLLATTSVLWLFAERHHLTELFSLIHELSMLPVLLLRKQKVWLEQRSNDKITITQRRKALRLDEITITQCRKARKSVSSWKYLMQGKDGWRSNKESTEHRI